MMILFLLVVVPLALAATVALWGFAGCGINLQVAPDAVSFEAKAQDNGTIELSWEHAALGFVRYEYDNPADTNGTSITIPNSFGRYVDSDVVEGTTYRYRLLTGPDLGFYSGDTLTTAKPRAPNSVKAIRKPDGHIALTWINTSSSRDFIIQVKIGNGQFVGIFVVHVDTFPYTVDAPAQTGALQYQVMSVVMGYQSVSLAAGATAPARVQIRSIPSVDPNSIS